MKKPEMFEIVIIHGKETSLSEKVLNQGDMTENSYYGFFDIYF